MINFTKSHIAAEKSMMREISEREQYVTGVNGLMPSGVLVGEQFYGVTPEYRLMAKGQYKGMVEIRLMSLANKEVSPRAHISYDEFQARPKSGREKKEASWAFNLCSYVP